MRRFIIIIEDLKDDGEIIDCFGNQCVAKNPVVTIADADSCETCLSSCTVELHGVAYERCELSLIQSDGKETLQNIEEGFWKNLLLASEIEIDLPQKFNRDPIAKKELQKLYLLLRWTITIRYGKQIVKLPVREVNLPRNVRSR